MIKTIKFNGVEYAIKQSFRSLMEFEKITGKNAFDVNASISDSITIFYCMLKTANEIFPFSFDDFTRALDDNPNALATFNDYLLSLQVNETATGEKKKKETR